MTSTLAFVLTLLCLVGGVACFAFAGGFVMAGDRSTGNTIANVGTVLLVAAVLMIADNWRW